MTWKLGLNLEMIFKVVMKHLPDYCRGIRDTIIITDRINPKLFLCALFLVLLYPIRMEGWIRKKNHFKTLSLLSEAVSFNSKEMQIIHHHVIKKHHGSIDIYFYLLLMWVVFIGDLSEDWAIGCLFCFLLLFIGTQRKLSHNLLLS